jgi:hypothetical protein
LSCPWRVFERNALHAYRVFEGRWGHSRWGMLPIYAQALRLIKMINMEQSPSIMPLLVFKESTWRALSIQHPSNNLTPSKHLVVLLSICFSPRIFIQSHLLPSISNCFLSKFSNFFGLNAYLHNLGYIGDLIPPFFIPLFLFSLFFLFLSIMNNLLLF